MVFYYIHNMPSNPKVSQDYKTYKWENVSCKYSFLERVNKKHSVVFLSSCLNEDI